MQPPRRQHSALFPSPCTQGEGRGEGSSAFPFASWRLGGSIIFLAILGCAVHSQPQPQAPPSQQVISGDAAPPVDPLAIHAEMYRLQMPFGANSRDESFWKLVDEDVLDIATTQNLSRNGFRTGRARIADWPAFLKILTDESAIKLSDTSVLARPSFQDAQLPMSDVLPEEILFIFDEHGLTMRSFNNCRNMLSMAFEWAPRKPRTIRLTLCPMVLAQGNSRRENFYDLHLQVDIAPGEFFIVGTSTATEDPNRIASRFLTRDGPNQRYEQLLIFVGEPGPMADMRFHRPRTTTK